MADPTPPADVPDPASTNPAPAGSKRIRSMPTRERGSSMTSAISSSPAAKESNWLRGASVLWVLFLLAALAEVANEVCTLLGGHAWPQPFDAVRAGLFFTLFVGLWVGWGWLRYILALVQLPSALWLAVTVIAANHTPPKIKDASIVMAPPPFSFLESMPKAALALIFVIMAFYLIISADVLAFVRHRRASGRAWTAFIAALFAYAFLYATLAGQPFYARWLASQEPDANSTAKEMLGNATEKWDPAAVESVGDPGFVKDWATDGRKSTFVGNAVLGPLQNAEPPLEQVQTDLKGFGPFQAGGLASSPILSGTSRDGRDFLLGYRYVTPLATFAHGHGPISIDLVRQLSGRWRVVNFDTVRVIPDPTPTPPPTPAPEASPTGSPGTVAPGASPAAASASPAPGPSAAPSASIVPPVTGATPKAPVPAVTAPAATPVPSAGH